MWKIRLTAALILALGVGFGWLVYDGQVNGTRPFRLGLDLSGGTQLVYRADLSAISEGDANESMAALRDTIERRVNLFGVSEPIVQTQHGGTFAGDPQERLIVELPGITIDNGNEVFEMAAITGKHLASAQLQFDQSLGARPNDPVVALNFNSEGADIFAELTRNNVGKYFGIFLDGVPISIPVIREAIPGGTAVISGGFDANEAKELARNLNYGALPVPIELIGTQTVSGTLGAEAVERGITATLWGILAVVLFMIFWYRLPGIVAFLALSFYIVVILALFQWIPVTLTAAGIAAFILSVGMAVDANVLIFERMKEELRGGKDTADSIRDGFARAWLSIRDSNISSMITAIILFWFGTSLIKGFALVFGLGVLVSMLSSITISRTLLLALGVDAKSGILHFFFGSGIRN